MPRWNFETENAAPEVQHQAKKGTLRSHQINMTFRDDGTVRHHTVAKHPSLAMMAQLAEAGLVSCPSCAHATQLVCLPLPELVTGFHDSLETFCSSVKVY